MLSRASHSALAVRDPRRRAVGVRNTPFPDGVQRPRALERENPLAAKKVGVRGPRSPSEKISQATPTNDVDTPPPSLAAALVFSSSPSTPTPSALHKPSLFIRLSTLTSNRRRCLFCAAKQCLSRIPPALPHSHHYFWTASPPALVIPSTILASPPLLIRDARLLSLTFDWTLVHPLQTHDRYATPRQVETIPNQQSSVAHLPVCLIRAGSHQ